MYNDLIDAPENFEDDGRDDKLSAFLLASDSKELVEKEIKRINKKRRLIKIKKLLNTK